MITKIPIATPTYFSDYFGISRRLVDKYGAFDISLVTDLPLFIDPFLLFNSKKPAYRHLHAELIRYLSFLRDKSDTDTLDTGLLDALFRFPEIRQTWLGFARTSNRGSGLGRHFATSLRGNLHRVFPDFGKEQLTKSSHLEKLCLIEGHVGRDKISDFTTNLILGFLCEYTQAFAREHLTPDKTRLVTIRKVAFNYDTETWTAGTFTLPWAQNDYVLLTPKNLLTKDDTWINRTDLVEQFDRLPDAIPDQQLRAQVNNYFAKVLGPHPKRPPTKKEQGEAAVRTILEFPQLVDVYIRYKEDHGEAATSVSADRVKYSERLYREQFGQLQNLLAANSTFYSIAGNTYGEAHQRVAFLKDVIENKGGHRLFYVNGQPVKREEDIQIAYRLTWFGTPSDVSREVNDGRGPADYKVSRGSQDKTIVEFKLASNSQLRRNLLRQAEVYQKASDAHHKIKVILFFSETELKRVKKILKELKLLDSRDIVLIDARADNKPSGSNA